MPRKSGLRRVDIVERRRVGPGGARGRGRGRHGLVGAERITVDAVGWSTMRRSLKGVANPRRRGGTGSPRRAWRRRGGAGGDEIVRVAVGRRSVEVGLLEEVVVLLDGLSGRTVVFDGDFGVAAVGGRVGMESPLIDRALRG